MFFPEGIASVAKPALGRGLGNLLGGAKTAYPVSDQTEREPVNLSPGMASLLRVENGHAQPDGNRLGPNSTAKEIPQLHRGLIRTSLVMADLLLVSLTGWLVFATSGPLGFWGATLIMSAMALGAWLTCLALHL